MRNVTHYTLRFPHTLLRTCGFASLSYDTRQDSFDESPPNVLLAGRVALFTG